MSKLPGFAAGSIPHVILAIIISVRLQYQQRNIRNIKELLSRYKNIIVVSKIRDIKEARSPGLTTTKARLTNPNKSPSIIFHK